MYCRYYSKLSPNTIAKMHASHKHHTLSNLQYFIQLFLDCRFVKSIDQVELLIGYAILRMLFEKDFQMSLSASNVSCVRKKPS